MIQNAGESSIVRIRAAYSDAECDRSSIVIRTLWQKKELRSRILLIFCYVSEWHVDSRANLSALCVHVFYLEITHTVALWIAFSASFVSLFVDIIIWYSFVVYRHHSDWVIASYRTRAISSCNSQFNEMYFICSHSRKIVYAAKPHPP